MITVSPLKDITEAHFNRLFKEYYTELDCGENIPQLLEEYIIPDCKAGLISVDILEDDGCYAGFVIYQIDDIDNDWNFKEGWGDVREIYVTPAFRRKGLGRFLLYTAEMKLQERGADKCYCLPCESALAFFTKCGYVKTDGYCEELDCGVYVKENLNNCCK